MCESKAATRGVPSMVWREGQDRRLQMIRRDLELQGASLLDVGCGVGSYMLQLAAQGAGPVVGTEIEIARAREAREAGAMVAVAAAEALPFAEGSFDAVLSHEVLEHVADDHAAAREMVRVLHVGGRAVIFVPNRWWPFETHGIVWRGTYRFGNAPLVNYLPDPLRNVLAPHVRTYTAGTLRSLFGGLPVRIVRHTQVYPGFDKMAARRPGLANVLRQVSGWAEATRAACFGLSHLLVVERTARERH
jgi:SAM-dependent methyltransferase